MPRHLTRNTLPPTPGKALHPSQGLSLIEVLVAMTIALVTFAAVGRIITNGEQHKRQLLSRNDMELSAHYTMLQLDSMVRSAGSGFYQFFDDYRIKDSCLLALGEGSQQLLPRLSPWPAPFEKIMKDESIKNLVLAPVLIAEKTGAYDSDSLVIMRSNARAGDVVRDLESPGTAKEWFFPTTLGFRKNDLILAGNADFNHCLFAQVDEVSGVSEVTVKINNNSYYTPTSPPPPEDNNTNQATLEEFSARSGINSSSDSENTLKATYIINFGKPESINSGSQQLYMLGIDDKQQLNRYNILTDEDNLVIADNIVAMYALYAMINNSTEKFSWHSPNEPAYSFNEMTLNRSSRQYISQIAAIRLALVVRSPIPEKDIVSNEKLTLFAGLEDKEGNSLEKEFEITDDSTGLENAQHYRHRVIETSIPIRNSFSILN